jgi:K+-transporting ATPase ATPase A chain
VTWTGVGAILSVVFLILVLGIPLGDYLFGVYTNRPSRLDRLALPVERALYRAIGVNPAVPMDWKAYVKALLLVNLVMLLFAYIMLRIQGALPLNPEHISSMSWDLAFNTAVSFTTNTNWQSYAGESSMSYLGQMVPIIYLQFTSAATGLVAAIAVVRAFRSQKEPSLGNFWQDFVRTHTRVLVPLAVVLAVVLAGLGLPATLAGAALVHTLNGGLQTIARGPVAALEAIKQLGNNGGGFFNTNSAHPFEDPTALTDVLEILAMALIPTALIRTFGRLIDNPRQATVLYVFLTALLLAGVFLVYGSETAGNPILAHVLGIHGANWEGKEIRFGQPLSALFVAATTAFTTGAVNTMHDSLTPLGGLVPLVFMMFNMVYGSLGAGLLNILLFLIITVFLSGLMVGRTPEIFGKKVEAREIKLATAAMLVHPFVILVPTALAVATRMGLLGILNPGLHGFSEVLYGFTSGAANNGSAFAGLNANTPFYNVAIGLDMLCGRYVSIVAMFAMAGSLAMKGRVPVTVGTLRTDTFSFGAVFVAVTVIVGALTFFPALAVGPIGEHIQLWAQHLAR